MFYENTKVMALMEQEEGFAKDNHVQLVKIIRNLHLTLRKSFQKVGDHETVWKLHVNDTESREKYSAAMLSIATKIWDKQHPNNTRIEWCYNKWSWYYFGPGFVKHIAKDYRKKYSCSLNAEEFDRLSDLEGFRRTGKVKVLDVGSCYNPFSKYDNCDCLAIDLTPATKDVYQCDFLNLQVNSKPPTDFSNFLESSASIENPIRDLPEKYFDVVVFSLLLEYLPSTKQRWICCQKARMLLKKYGLLLIITPDSKHVNKNAPIMKNWKEAMESLGFDRIVYEKQKHLHCMAFRNICDTDKDDLVNCKHQLLAIPQDTKSFDEVDYEDLDMEMYERTDEESTEIAYSFTELPFS